ncbi:MAG: putative sigma-54 interacting response regulator transcription regulator protein [Nevskia sp.]|nr:putative sigma-54 interacting response regulator transcription regulator protein [Nevskia sp.]
MTQGSRSGALRVLWVDDDYDLTHGLIQYFSSQGYLLDCVEDLASATRQLGKADYDLVLVDLDLPDGSGLTLIRDAVHSQGREFVIITGHSSVMTAVEALRYQVFDYLVKPVQLAELDNLLARIGSARKTPGAPRKAAAGALRSASGATPAGIRLIGDSPAIKHAENLLTRAAATDITVLLQGESGTGKEVAASLVHRLSHRAAGPFVAYNCAAISPALIASELFGHEKGSFTGASGTHKGIFERAEGGTLLLDEITEMPLELQVSLLRVLETGTVMRVGGDNEIRVNVRIVAATNRDPMLYVKDGKFRLDLYYRLQVFPVAMPPLRSRLQDLPLLVEYFLGHSAATAQRKYAISPAATARLQSHHWPGNVRELRNVMERACLLSGGTIEPEHLLLPDLGVLDEPLPGENKPRPGSGSKGTLLRDAEYVMVLQVLADCNGNKTRAAARLGISLKTLYNKLRRFDGELPEQPHDVAGVRPGN